ncbi:MAG TPA: DUF4192 domain-containing protein [Nocardioidaceae bacterium]|nr:DUF4192 domain-containing protein [Nocardioidaceae bacterium]
MSEPTQLRNEPASGRRILKAKSPGDLLALVPYRVGFHPTESLVVITVAGPRKRLGFSMRVDLPPPEHLELVADQVSEALRRNKADRVVMVVYTQAPQRAQPLVDEMLRRFDSGGIDVLEALRADGKLWFPYLCDGPCCPAEGTAYDNSCHPLAAQAVLEGGVALPDRATLEASVAPVCGIAAVSMMQAAARAEDELLTLAAAGWSAEEIRTALERQMRDLVQDYLGDPRRLDDNELARAAVWAQFIPVRDVAWRMMSRADAGAHLTLWRQALRRVPPPYEPAVACLAAFAAWLHGDGALACCALERALGAAPDYSMANLIDQTLRAAIPPSSWDELPAAM